MESEIERSTKGKKPRYASKIRPGVSQREKGTRKNNSEARKKDVDIREWT